MTKQISYSFNEMQIVGAVGQAIYVKTLMYDYQNDDDVEQWICLVFSMTKWIELQKAWVNCKKDFCERYQHFCGWGSVSSECSLLGEIDLRIDPDFRDPNFDFDTHDFSKDIKMVPVYRPKDFFVDMEHG